MLIFDKESDVSSIETEGMFLDGGDFYFQKVSVLLHYIIIYIYIYIYAWLYIYIYIYINNNNVCVCI